MAGGDVDTIEVRVSPNREGSPGFMSKIRSGVPPIEFKAIIGKAGVCMIVNHNRKSSLRKQPDASKCQ